MTNQVEFTLELMPTECLVKLPSKHDGKSNKRPLFLVHAIEGVVTPLKAMAAEMTCPVWGLQCVSDAPLETITELAKFYVKQLKTVQPKGPYTVAGYSFGAAVAFEMVTQLEAQKESCSLIMLDGSPRYVSWYTESQSKKTSIAGSPAQAEAYCLAYFAMVAGNLHYTTVAKELEILNSWEDRLTACAKIVSEATKHDKELVCTPKDCWCISYTLTNGRFSLQVKTTAFVFYKKIMAGHLYRPEQKIKGRVCLIKCTKSITKHADDYGLIEVS